ncbi:MAG: flagellin hook IN motif-containing protein [Woeseiaceae bacterium]|nr:flagellin hook IN motif-containing protein [Woeseiaceae bacterium]
MSVITQLANLAGSIRIRSAGPAVPAATAPATPLPDGRGDLLEARSRLLRIERALEAIAEIAGLEPRFRLDLPDARSTAALGLDLTETAATLASVGEINAAPMSFAPFGPDWSGTSTALLTIGGEYDGSHGTGALTFEVTRDGIRGQDNLRIRVDDPLGQRIDNFNIRTNEPLDQRYDLGNGLFFTLGNGALVDGETATLNVYDSVGAAVDPDLPLGGVRNLYPNFQYYPDPNGLPPIVDGSFELNGEPITVSTADTINTVVDRINAADAGVTAVFNALTERIEFVQNTTGAAPTIVLANDDSNFLVSTKLDTAVVNPGTDPETRRLLADVARFSSVQAGSIVINGTAIAVDPAVDSLETVLDDINNSAAGVTATFDETTQLVTIAADDSESVLEIDSNGTGLFPALLIPEGRVDPELRAGGISLRRSYEIADAFEVLATELNGLFRDGNFETGGTYASLFRSPLDAALRGIYGDLESAFGISFDRSANALRRGDFAAVDRRDFTRSLQIRGDDVKAFFAGDDGSGGLVGALFTATRQALQNVGGGLARTGAFVDTFA